MRYEISNQYSGDAYYLYQYMQLHVVHGIFNVDHSHFQSIKSMQTHSTTYKHKACLGLQLYNYGQPRVASQNSAFNCNWSRPILSSDADPLAHAEHSPALIIAGWKTARARGSASPDKASPIQVHDLTKRELQLQLETWYWVWDRARSERLLNLSGVAVLDSFTLIVDIRLSRSTGSRRARSDAEGVCIARQHEQSTCHGQWCPNHRTNLGKGPGSTAVLSNMYYIDRGRSG